MMTISKDQLVRTSLITILVLILISVILSFWNRYVLYDTSAVIDRARKENALAQSLQGYLECLELCLYRSSDDGQQTHFERYLALRPRADSVTLFLTELKKKFPSSQKVIGDYQDSFATRVYMLDKAMQSMRGEDLVFKGLPEDADYDAHHAQFIKEVNRQLSEEEAAARSDYEWSITDNAIIQVILLVLSVPILLNASRSLRNEVKNRKSLLVGLQENNKTFLFDDGQPFESAADRVVGQTIARFRKVFDIIRMLSAGDFNAVRDAVPSELREKNQSSMVGLLAELNDRLEANENERLRREWISKGLNLFNEIVREHQHNKAILAERATAFLVKYLEAQQGSMFSKRNKEGEEYLIMDACFAFDRKKFVEKEIPVGNGIIGQAFLEGSAVLMTELPPGYIHITSGLGHATPTSIMVVPLFADEEVHSIFEAAGFKRFESHEVEFVKQAGGYYATAIRSAERRREMEELLERTVMQAEAMKAQEEELRQNMEELAATNEALMRNEKYQTDSVTNGAN